MSRFRKTAAIRGLSAVSAVSFSTTEAAVVAPFTYLGIVFSSLWSVLFFDDWPDGWTLVGALEHGHLQQPAAMSTASLAELEGEWPLAGLMTLRAISPPV